MAVCGGARGERDVESSAAGVVERDSRMWALTCRANSDASQGAGCAGWDVITARLQSRWQQVLLRTERWSDCGNDP